MKLLIAVHGLMSKKNGFANDLFDLLQGFIDLEDDTENNDE